MIRKLSAVLIVASLGACQTTAYPKLTYNAANADKIMQAAYDVCVANIGDPVSMQEQAKSLTGDVPQSKRIRVEGEWHDIDHYRFYDGDDYLAFFSIYQNGKGCAVNYASGSVPQHIATQTLSIDWIDGTYEHARFGRIKSEEVGVEYVARIGGETVFDMVLFLDAEWTAVETDRTGAPSIEWNQ